jgi:hypothetical protein
MVDTETVCLMIFLSPIIFLMLSTILLISFIISINNYKKKGRKTGVIVSSILIILLMISSGIIGINEYIFLRSGKENYDYSIEIVQNTTSPYYVLLPDLINVKDDDTPLSISEYSKEPDSFNVEILNTTLMKISSSQLHTKLSYSGSMKYFGGHTQSLELPGHLIERSNTDHYLYMEIFYFSEDNSTCILDLEFKSGWSSNLIGGGEQTYSIHAVLENGVNNVMVDLDTITAD